MVKQQVTIPEHVVGEIVGIDVDGEIDGCTLVGVLDVGESVVGVEGALDGVREGRIEVGPAVPQLFDTGRRNAK